MKTGRQALEEIKSQVANVRFLQMLTKDALEKAEKRIRKAKAHLKKLVDTFPKKEKELYTERIKQITKRYL